jgi:hypothetical protein
MGILGVGIVLITIVLMLRSGEVIETMPILIDILFYPIKIPFLRNVYIALLILFILSVTGILRSDKDDNAKLFYGSVMLFIFSLVAAVFIWFFSAYALIALTA